MMILDPYRFGAAGGGGGIQLVGQKTATITATAATNVSLTDLTGGLASAPAAGDVVLVAVALARNADRDLVAATGYTEVNEVYVSGTTYNTNLMLAYKVMGSTPDTLVTISGNDNTGSSTAVAIKVFRGVDAVVLDVAQVTTTAGQTTRPNPGSITPVTSGALIVAAGGGASHTSQAGGVYTTSDMDEMVTAYIADTGLNTSVGMAQKAWTGGAFDAAAWGGGVNATGASAAAITIALRPA